MRLDRTFRSLKALERTGSTSRYINLHAISERTPNPREVFAPLFSSPALGGAIILKHKLRADEHVHFDTPRHTATKVVIPFERTDLALGGRSFFVKQRGWVQLLGSLQGRPAADERDVLILETLDELPSLDPFLVRYRLKSKRIFVPSGYFLLSTADVDRINEFVRSELEGLVRLACGSERIRSETNKLAKAIIAGDDDIRLSTLGGALRLDRSEHGEGLFCWRGCLYYKWLIQQLNPALSDVLVALNKIRLVGPRREETVTRIQELTSELSKAFVCRTQRVTQLIADYDEAFGSLRSGANPAAFARFLQAAPSLFQVIGHDVGLLAHVVSYWGYRFSGDRALLAYPDELVEVLDGFVMELSG